MTPAFLETAGAARAVSQGITAAALGSQGFRADYRLQYAYLAGAMYQGVASREMVIALGRAGLMGYFGTGGLSLDEIEAGIHDIRGSLGASGSYGMNLLCNPAHPHIEERTVRLLLQHDIRYIEAAAFTNITPALALCRLKGVAVGPDGVVRSPRRILAKVSRPEVATAFLRPAADAIVRRLVEAGTLDAREAELGRLLPMADEICVEADSGGHTDGGIIVTLFPAMLALRDQIAATDDAARRVRIGAAGGIGTPHAAAAAFAMGADFVLTGSINQCTVEAATSDAVKDMLQAMNVHDTAYAPAGDMFEIGARVQVLKKGLLFAARANRLHDLYTRHESLDEIDAATRQQIQERYFHRTFEDVWRETKAYYLRTNPRMAEDAERHPKRKMALVFKWYFVHTSRLARQGSREQQVDYQVHCGPALGAFNQWVKGTFLEAAENRSVVQVALNLLEGAATISRAQQLRAHGVPVPNESFQFVPRMLRA